ncbi:alpha/beta fold hydrolase [Tsukamurella soli]|uniref:Alpha/beta hydrolase n=1 Tax=Tsukamurella soli TaxID=644556 RepID=A0ABP8K5J5_9ACTN
MTGIKVPVPPVVVGLGSALAVATSAGVTYAGRVLGLRRDGPDPLEGLDLAFAADRESVILSHDGIPLHVREVGPLDAPVTVVFVHGFTLRSASWLFVRAELERRWGPRVRMVFPDCRGHGDSGAATAEQSTVELLGDDIVTVLDALAPTGPVVLVGHSMGGMAIFACASRHPELFGSRIVGVGLLGTSAHGLTETGLAANLTNPIIDIFRLVIRYLPTVVGHGREIAKPLIGPLIVAGSYGPGRRSATMERFSSSMSLTVPLATMAGFFTALERYDERAGLATLRRVVATVVCGDHDWMTPLGSSEHMAQELDCRFVVLSGAGHMLIMEAADNVALEIAELVARATVAAS